MFSGDLQGSSALFCPSFEQVFNAITMALTGSKGQGRLGVCPLVDQERHARPVAVLDCNAKSSIGTGVAIVQLFQALWFVVRLVQAGDNTEGSIDGIYISLWVKDFISRCVYSEISRRLLVGDKKFRWNTVLR